jgi:WD40 repeat protein
MSTVASDPSTEEAASRNDDASQKYDGATPAIPINVISHWVLPFVEDRRTWNAVCGANKELHEASMTMTPPWPKTKLTLTGQMVGCVEFSPCGSFLACGSCQSPYLLDICDRRGSLTRLTGHTSSIGPLSFSSDGKYLASAGCEASIRIWPTNSARMPQQSDKELQRNHPRSVVFMDFSSYDSNLLASADHTAVKLWNVEREVCIYSFDVSWNWIRSLCFPPGRENRHTCIFLRANGSLIRACWDDLSGITSDIVVMPGLGRVSASAFSHCGSLLAAMSSEGEAVTLYNMRTMTVVQRTSIQPHVDHLAFSPNGKTLVFAFYRQNIDICEVHDLNIRRRLQARQEHAASRTLAVAFDPSSKFLAWAGQHGDVQLWTL